MPNSQQQKTAARDSFQSRFGVIAATLGSAVGLGNIWRFPYETGAGGGAGFLVIYLIASLLVGLPLMMAEISIGRAARTDSVGAYKRLINQTRNDKRTLTPWSLVGIFGVITVILIIAFYSDVVGWVLAYIAKSLSSTSILTQDQTALEEAFGQTISAPAVSLGWQLLVLVAIAAILLFGVSKGIEGVTKKLMPLLALLLLAVAIRSLTMPGAIEGVKFLFVPKLSDINANVILTALGLAFFKLSLGVGSITTYGSYFLDDQDIPKTALTVMVSDLCMSLLAGLAIFPAVFALGFDPQAGPSLLFLTLPAVFAAMPGGHLLMVVFFALTALAAVGALLSLVEVPVSVLSERLQMSRKRALIITVVVLMAVGSLASLSFSTLSHITVAGMNFFDLFDFVTSKIMMPLVGVLIAMFIAHGWKRENFVNELTNSAQLDNKKLANVISTVLIYLAPILVVTIVVAGLRQ